MKLKVEHEGFPEHAALLLKKLEQRIPVEHAEDGLRVCLSVDHTAAGREGYRIDRLEDGWKITGADSLGLYFGIGKLLHTAKWSETQMFPNPPEGSSQPACSFRCIYFSVHNYNWYHVASSEELEDYLLDLMLWGYNTIHCIIPVMNIREIGDEVFRNSVEITRRLFSLAKKNGMRTSLGINPNQGLLSAPHEFDNDASFNLLLRENYGRNLCPSKPEANAYLRTLWQAKFEALADIGIDYIICWPYDEGGCNCERCRPWGAKGYCDVCLAVREEALRWYPNVEFIICTWAFDATADEGEYAGLYQRLNGDMAWADYLMVDAHGDYPRYVLEHPVIKPVVNFPEISMWELCPWGGFGANPMPKRFQEIWDSSRSVLKGGMPYSEGLYEDISKIQFAGYYWDPERSYQDILTEYISYEYDAAVCQPVLEIMELIEQNHVAAHDCRQPDLNAAHRAAELAWQVDEMLSPRAKASWRWRMLFIRAVLDEKRYCYFVENRMGSAKDFRELRVLSGNFLVHDEQAQQLFRELLTLDHDVEENEFNVFTRPPVGGAKWV